MPNVKALNFNERRIIESLRSAGMKSRAHLARHLSVSPPTITRLTSNLLEMGLLSEHRDPSDNVKMGYPSKLLNIEPTGLYTVGVFFDPDYIHTCICDLAGSLVSNERLDVQDRSFVSIMSRAGNSVSKQVERSGINTNNVAGVGVSYPGHFTSDPSRVFKIKQFSAWPDINVEVDLEPYFDFPVFHMSDSKAAILAEHYYGACRTISNFCLIHLSYGIGGAAIIDHRLVIGQNKDAAEFGGLFPKSKPRPSGQNLIDTLRESGQNVGRLSEVNEVQLKLPAMHKWLENSTMQLRWLCLTIARTFDPQAIVFGGSLPTAITDHFVSEIGQAKSLGEDFNLTPPTILRATKDDHPQIGAAALPIYSLFSPDTFSGQVTKGR